MDRTLYCGVTEGSHVLAVNLCNTGTISLIAQLQVQV